MCYTQYYGINHMGRPITNNNMYHSLVKYAVMKNDNKKVSQQKYHSKMLLIVGAMRRGSCHMLRCSW